VVSRAERRRRVVATARQVARIAPLVASVAAVTALAVRLASGPVLVPLGLLGAGVLGLGAYALARHRATTVSDRDAARLDADAGLAGELRSAAWFADRADGSGRDPFVEWHLDEAARHLDAVAWDGVYPPVRATRSWLSTAGLAALALLLVIHIPSARATAARAVAINAQGAATGVRPGIVLPPELRRRLQALLSKLEAGTVSADEATAQARDLLDLLSHVAASQAAGEAGRAAGSAAAMSPAALREQQALAERTANDALSQANEELRADLQDLASRLTEGPSVSTPGGTPSHTIAQAGRQGGGRSTTQPTAGAMSETTAIQIAREAASDSAGSQMLVGGGGALGSDPRAGSGGGRGAPGDGRGLTGLAGVLHRELVEAAADASGENVTAADVRRRTGQGHSQLAFTGVRLGDLTGRSPAAPPPAVPDVRRALILSYFMPR
jgi:hypothetical protein